MAGWLRQILVRTLANQAKHHRARGRDLRRQESLEAMLERSSLAVQAALATPTGSMPRPQPDGSSRCSWPMRLNRTPAYREVFVA